MAVRWMEGTADVRCPVCGRPGDQKLMALADAFWRDEPVEIARCRGCDAIVLGAVMEPDHYTATDIDRYIEYIGSVETIANLLAIANAPPGSRMVDIGCAYGFAVDVGERVFGWRCVGLDPSDAAARGRADLGIDIRPGLLDDSFDPDERFDVIFASEVLEHIPQPREFLHAVRDRLAPGGVFVLTTPDARAVSPKTADAVLNAVLSVSAHEFLVDAEGLERLLRDAGFHARVRSGGAGLRAVAALAPDALARAHLDAVADTDALIRYCAERAQTASPSSPLGIGMAVRHLAISVAAHRFDAAERALVHVRRSVSERYGLDFDSFDRLVPADEPPQPLVDAHYYAALVARHHHDLRGELDHFAAAAEIAQAVFDFHGLYPHPMTAQLHASAFGEAALSLATARQPEQAEAMLAELDRTVARGVGSPELAAGYRGMVRGERPIRKRARRYAGGAVRRARRLVTRGRPSSGHRA